MGFGEILHCVEVVDPLDAIPGVPLNPEQGCVPYVQYRGRFVGTLTLKKDERIPPTIYAYDMKVWIVAPRDPAHGNGAVIVNPLHTTAFDKLKVPFPVSTPASPFFNAPRNLPQREQPLALKMLGTKFLFRRGKVADTDRSANYTWVGVRWDSRACGHPARYDGDYENNHSMVAALNVGA